MDELTEGGWFLVGSSPVWLDAGDPVPFTVDSVSFSVDGDPVDDAGLVGELAALGLPVVPVVVRGVPCERLSGEAVKKLRADVVAAVKKRGKKSKGEKKS